MNLVSSIRVLVDGLDHPEGVAYDHAAGVLYAGGEAGQVYAVDITEGSFREVARTPGFVLGLAVDGQGRVEIVEEKAHRRPYRVLDSNGRPWLPTNGMVINRSTLSFSSVCFFSAHRR